MVQVFRFGLRVFSEASGFRVRGLGKTFSQVPTGPSLAMSWWGIFHSCKGFNEAA